MNGFQELNYNELYQIEGGFIQEMMEFAMGYGAGLVCGFIKASLKPAKPAQPRPEPIHRGVGNGNP